MGSLVVRTRLYVSATHTYLLNSLCSRARMLLKISYGNARVDYIRNPTPPISTFSPRLFTSLQPSAANFCHRQVLTQAQVIRFTHHSILYCHLSVTPLSLLISRALLCNVSSESGTHHYSSFATSIDVRHWGYATHGRGAGR